MAENAVEVALHHEEKEADTEKKRVSHGFT
jgi:hypothetical protein